MLSYCQAAASLLGEQPGHLSESAHSHISCPSTRLTLLLCDDLETLLDNPWSEHFAHAGYLSHLAVLLSWNA